jgi:dTMP kinase
LDIPAEIGLKRSLSREQETNTDNTRFENMELSFHKRVREGFKKIAGKHSNRVHSLNAEKPIEEVTKDIINLLSKTFIIELNTV